MIFGELFFAPEELIESGTIEKSAAQDDGADFAGVADIVEGIGVEEDKVGAFSLFDRARVFGGVKKFRRVRGGGLKGLERCQAGLDQQLQFVVKTVTGENIRSGGIGTGENLDAGFLHFGDDKHGLLQELSVHL